MRAGRRKNTFSDSTRFMFLDDNEWVCWHCGMNHSNCIHHIFGRGKEEGCEKSPLNAAPLNNFECHLAHHGYHMTSEGRKKLLTKTINFLSDEEYILTDLDNEFLKKYGLEIHHMGLKL